MITEETVVVASQHLAASELDGEAVLLGYDSGLYHGLNEVGTRVWNLIQAPSRVGDVCRQLLGEYDVEPARCRREVISLLEDLWENGLIEIRRAGAPPAA